MAGERILIVEDEGIVAADLESTLKKLGYEVVSTVTTGEEAVEKAEATSPDLVLMDIRLKGNMDGIDAAEQITARLNVPVTFLTAYADEKTLDRAKTTLPYGYILKPFQERELRAATEMALYKHRMETFMATLESWHATTLRNIPEAVIATDKKGYVTFMNDMAESLLGWTLPEMSGKKLADILVFRQEKSSQPVSISLEEILRNQKPVHSEQNLLLSLKDGHTTWVQYQASSSKDAEGKVTGVIVVLRDVWKASSPEMTVPLPR